MIAYKFYQYKNSYFYNLCILPSWGILTLVLHILELLISILKLKLNAFITLSIWNL